MRGIFRSLAVGMIAGVFALIGTYAVKAEEKLIAPAPSSASEQPVLSGLFVGQTHKYRVIFRGNREAIVYLNIDFTNTTDNSINEFVFEAPVSVNDMTILQYSKVQCDYNYTYDTVRDKCVYRYAPDYNSSTSLPYYYGGEQNVYEKAKFTVDGNKYTVSLPTSVAVNADSYLLIGFTTKNFASEILGGFNYTFESVKVNSRISTLSISIDVDEDLILKNATTSAVDYSSAGVSKVEVDDSAAVVNRDLDNLVNSMAYAGSIFKTYKELSSNETVTLSGEYASGWFRLYLKEIVIAVVVVALIFVALFVGIKLWRKNHKPTEKKPEQANSKTWIIVDAALGFGSALAILIFTLVLMYISSTMTYYGSWYGYGYGYGILMILVMLIIVLIYGFLALFAPIFRAKKRGWASFGVVFGTEILFLIIMALIFVSIWVVPQAYPLYAV